MKNLTLDLIAISRYMQACKYGNMAGILRKIVKIQDLTTTATDAGQSLVSKLHLIINTNTGQEFLKPTTLRLFEEASDCAGGLHQTPGLELRTLELENLSAPWDRGHRIPRHHYLDGSQILEYAAIRESVDVKSI